MSAKFVYGMIKCGDFALRLKVNKDSYALRRYRADGCLVTMMDGRNINFPSRTSPRACEYSSLRLLFKRPCANRMLCVANMKPEPSATDRMYAAFTLLHLCSIVTNNYGYSMAYVLGSMWLLMRLRTTSFLQTLQVCLLGQLGYSNNPFVRKTCRVAYFLPSGMVAVDGQNSRFEEQWLSVDGKLIVHLYTSSFFNCSDLKPFEGNRIATRMVGLRVVPHFGLRLLEKQHPKTQPHGKQ